MFCSSHDKVSWWKAKQVAAPLLFYKMEVEEGVWRGRWCEKSAVCACVLRKDRGVESVTEGIVH